MRKSFPETPTPAPLAGASGFIANPSRSSFENFLNFSTAVESFANSDESKTS